MIWRVAIFLALFCTACSGGGGAADGAEEVQGGDDGSVIDDDHDYDYDHGEWHDAGDDGGGDEAQDAWKPSPGTSWQWQLTGTVDTSIDVVMYDIDLFDIQQATIDSLHADGRIVICYFSAGSRENTPPPFDISDVL